MQVTNILFRLSNLLNLNFAHLNDHLQTILQFEGDKVALTHIVKDKDLAPYLEDIIRKKAKNSSIYGKFRWN